MLLSTAYLPPLEYFQKIISSNEIFIERHEHFVKQTYRNRCNILSPNGVQSLSIPLINTHDKTPIGEKKIAYAENWQKQHWRSITTAYANSPYFIYYSDELQGFYESRFEHLIEYNTKILRVLLKMLKVKAEIKFTENFISTAENDFRNTISPKVKPAPTFKPYNQVFSEKLPFAPNLSIIDLLFNKGPETKEFLS
ncbi:MAG: WbqC family protein [Bacteroidia bacterium]